MMFSLLFILHYLRKMVAPLKQQSWRMSILQESLSPSPLKFNYTKAKLLASQILRADRTIGMEAVKGSYITEYRSPFPPGSSPPVG
jgi:hypothetical protein